MSITPTKIPSWLNESYDLLFELVRWQDELPDNIDVSIDIAGKDSLTGTQANELLVGLDGSDRLWGLSGKDFIIGGNGRDFLVGGSGRDILFGGSGNDSLVGDEGDDRLFGGSGKDVAKYSQQQHDYIFKGNSDEFQVIGADGRDTLRGIELLEFGDSLVETDSLNFLPAPLFSQIETIETTIPDTGDAIDIYLPTDANDKLPVALFLQGANVDKSNYSTFASVVASYGFAVVVPNNLRTVELPPPAPNLTGLLPELSQINEVFDYIRTPESPIAEDIDPDKLVLLGHSFGGAAGLYAIQGFCDIPDCPFGEYDRPDQLTGGVFFGTDLQPTLGAEGVPEAIPLLDNADIPTALILGTNDGISFPAETEETYEQIQDPPKALIEVEGTNHFGITNQNEPLNPPTVPAEVPPIFPEPNPQTIPQEVAIDTIATWSSLFLRATVLGDETATDFVFGGTGDELDSNVDVTSELPLDFF